MKFKLIIVTNKTDRKEIEMEGDLNIVKTYLKLLATNTFTWGAIERIDELKPGDVSHWIIQHNYRDNCLEIDPFTVYGTGIESTVNVNLFTSAFNRNKPGKDLGVVRDLLGGGSY